MLLLLKYKSKFNFSLPSIPTEVKNTIKQLNNPKSSEINNLKSVTLELEAEFISDQISHIFSSRNFPLRLKYDLHG